MSSDIECQEGPCGVVIEAAIRKGATTINSYQNIGGLDENGDRAKCVSHEVEFSHQVIYKLADDSRRTIVLVSECGTCHNDMFEEDYTFECVDSANCQAQCNFAQE